MSIIRAPSYPNYSDMFSDRGATMWAGWYTDDSGRHVAASGGGLSLRFSGTKWETACGLSLSSDAVLELIEQPCEDIPEDTCQTCRTWVKKDMERQAENPRPILMCGEQACSEPAKHVRHTQFSGNHPYCDVHARKEEDFGKDDPSYFFWVELSVPGGNEFERYKSKWGHV